MSWEEIRTALSYFIYGVALGYLWHPVWNILKKIWHEAKIAQQEWHGKSK